jgi:hypothetical protein
MRFSISAGATDLPWETLRLVFAFLAIIINALNK